MSEAFEASQTLSRFFRCLDENNFPGLVALMAPGGVWHRQGEQLSGEASIMAAMGKRPPHRRVHHLLSNLIADVSGNEATVTAYMFVVRHDGAVQGPAPLTGLESVRTLRVRMTRTAAGWRIQDLGGDPVSFQKAG